MALLTIERKTPDELTSLQKVRGVVTNQQTGTVEWNNDIKLPELTKDEMGRLIKAHTKSAPNFQRAKEVKAVYKQGDSVNNVMRKLGTKYSRAMIAIDVQAFRVDHPTALKNKFGQQKPSESDVRNKKTQ